MKRRYLFFIVLLTLILPVAGHTQEKATAIDSLAIDLWPDYDRASVLVLLTGTLEIYCVVRRRLGKLLKVLQ